jgi:type IV pilus assembly protein PilM
MEAMAILNIFKGASSSTLGIDIGTTSIKIVEVKPGKGRPEIVNYALLESSGYLARANQALQTSTLKVFESDIVDLLKTALREMRPGATEAVASLAPFSVFTTVLDFPMMGPKEIEQAMVYQAKQYIPLPLTEVALDWMKVGEYADEKGFAHQKLLLISVPKEQIRKYQEMFKKAGLALRELEIESLSLARLFANDPTPTIVVDIGSRSTNIVFLEGGSLMWQAQSDFASASLTQALATSLSVNPLRAEELKKERGIMGTGPNYELSTIMMPFLDAIINEVKKAQFAYQAQFPSGKPAERIVLAGGGANLLGIESYVAKEFTIPVVKSNPFSRFTYPEAVEPIVSELNPVMSVALGLGLKSIIA